MPQLWKVFFAATKLDTLSTWPFPFLTDYPNNYDVHINTLEPTTGSETTMSLLPLAPWATAASTEIPYALFSTSTSRPTIVESSLTVVLATTLSVLIAIATVSLLGIIVMAAVFVQRRKKSDQDIKPTDVWIELITVEVYMHLAYVYHVVAAQHNLTTTNPECMILTFYSSFQSFVQYNQHHQQNLSYNIKPLSSEWNIIIIVRMTQKWQV